MSRPTTHVVAYFANGRGNTDPDHGIALVTTDTHRRPTWHDCRAQIPHFVTGEYLGLAPGFFKEQQ